MPAGARTSHSRTAAERVVTIFGPRPSVTTDPVRTIRPRSSTRLVPRAPCCGASTSGAAPASAGRLFAAARRLAASAWRRTPGWRRWRDRAGPQSRSRASRTGRRPRQAVRPRRVGPGLALGRRFVTGPALARRVLPRGGKRSRTLSSWSVPQPSGGRTDPVDESGRPLPHSWTGHGARHLARSAPALAATIAGIDAAAGPPRRPKRSARGRKWEHRRRVGRSVAEPQRPSAMPNRAIASAAGRNPCRDRRFGGRIEVTYETHLVTAVAV